MKTKIALLAAAAAVCFTAVTANAQPQRDYRDNSYQNETREEWRREQERQQYREDPVSYTHLTLPTICSV